MSWCCTCCGYKIQRKRPRVCPVCKARGEMYVSAESCSSGREKVVDFKDRKKGFREVYNEQTV